MGRDHDGGDGGRDNAHVATQTDAGEYVVIGREFPQQLCVRLRGVCLCLCVRRWGAIETESSMLDALYSIDGSHLTIRYSEVG
jgi:hypothetical protein